MKNIKKYPVIIFFAIFLYGLSIADLFSPIEERSELENRDLVKFPEFHLKTLIENEYTPKIEDFTEDHFIMRNSWISLKSISESLLGKNENNGVVYGKDGYLFTKSLKPDVEQREKNITALEKFISTNSDKNINVMVVPTAPNILTQYVEDGSPVNKADELISQIKERIDSKYIFDVTDTLKSHSEESIFYRTDHHWTSLGAYYSYNDYMTNIGKSPKAKEDFNFVNVDNFLGTHYSKAKNFNVEPDTMTYVENNSQIEINGNLSPIYDYDKLDTRDKYAMFLRGNNAFSSVKGNGTDKILIIKDSYANSFIPFMTDDFSQIDIVDMRFYNSSVNKLVKENNYQQILFLYNSETFDTETTIPKINLFN